MSNVHHPQQMTRPISQLPLHQMRGATIKAETAGSTRSKTRLPRSKMMGLEPIPAGEIRERWHSVENGETRSRQVPMKASRTAMSCVCTSGFFGTVCESTTNNPEFARACEIAVLIEAHRGAQESDGRLPATQCISVKRFGWRACPGNALLK